MFSSKKLKYGSAAIVFTLVVIVLVVVLNVLLSTLSKKHNMSIDMTKEQYFTLSDETYKLLDEKFKDDPKEIEINFCTPLDKMRDNYSTNLIYETALQYQTRYDNVKVGYVDIFTHPKDVEKYRTATNSTIDERTVLISAEGGGFKMFDFTDFFNDVTQSGVSAVIYKGEYRFTSAILSILSDKPIAYFANNHQENNGTSAKRSEMWTLFEESGYEVKEIDLSKAENQLDENAEVIVLNGPKRDLMNEEGVNEAALLEAYLNKFISVMVFLDTETDYTDFENLNDLMFDWGGVAVSNAVICDDSKSISNDKKTTIEVTPTVTDELTSQLLRELTSTTLPKIIAKNARPITLDWTNNRQKTGDDHSLREFGSVLSTYDTAYAISKDDQEIGVDSPFDVMTITRRTRYVDNVEHYSYMIVCGTTEFANDGYLHNPSYANDDVMYTVMRLMGNKNVPAGVDYKFYNNNTLDITEEQANRWTAVITLVIPVGVLIAGIVIQIRRKHL